MRTLYKLELDVVVNRPKAQVFRDKTANVPHMLHCSLDFAVSSILTPPSLALKQKRRSMVLLHRAVVLC